jgi:hypothetical protein
MEPAVHFEEPKQPSPIMDVTPPLKTEPVREPAAEAPDPATEVKTAEPVKSRPAPKPLKTTTAPVGTIFLAIIFFVVLSALTYYAYTKTK